MSFYADSEYWTEWGKKVNAIWAEYDAARLETYKKFYERQTGIKPQPGDEMEVLGGTMVVPEDS